MPSPKILVYGDVMLDVYVTGAVARDSPEAPGVPILLMTDMSEFPGGAANVAANIASLGGQVMVVSVVGTDAPGELLESVLASRDVGMTFVVNTNGRTTSKTRFVANGRHLLRADTEATPLLSAEGEAAIMGHLLDLLPQAKAVVISDYAKGAVTPRMAAGAIGMARSRGIPVVVDTKTPHAAHFHGATVIKPNLREIAVALDMKEPPQTDKEVVRAATRLRSRSKGTSYVLLTRGDKGMCLVGDEGALKIEPYTVKAVDVTGAGDAVAAALAVALARGEGMVEAAQFANAAGAVVVTKSGTACPTPEEVRFFNDREFGRDRAAHSSVAQAEIQSRLH